MFFQKKSEFKSNLFNQKDFYRQFIQDLNNSNNEVIIESPYITSSRMETLYPVFKELLARRIHIHIVTRDPIDHAENIRHQSTNEILICNELGINIVLLRGYHHRKLVIVDRSILWEGSLNVLSYSNSQEVMRRIEGKEWAIQMIDFLRLKSLSSR
ncbi:MAG: phospholipase D-like domain-containing protein [Candidatus Roizmanbacteria bacterium]|nr:phospholipase D-like domain-containing protein [Candidatus Roizmanbacteria bacterium]